MLNVPPPPTIDAQKPPGPRFVVLRPGTPRCADGPALITRREPVLPGPAVPYGDQQPQAYRLRFTIDSGGRPLDISADGNVEPGWVDTSDVVPAFTTWRFAPRAARRGCTIAFTVDSRTADNADLSDVYRYLALPHENGWIDSAIFERAKPAGSTCFDPYPNFLVNVWPDWDGIAQPPGTMSANFIGFDIDGHGRPRDVRFLASGENTELDRQSLAALRRSRFVAGAKTGCTYNYHRTATQPLAAPPMPLGDTPPCGAEKNWTIPPASTYPAEFRRRHIEGWAIMRFDVAPWGEIGNISVVQAQPAEAFGKQAITVLRSARLAPSFRGYTGCTQHVRFRMPAPS